MSPNNEVLRDDGEEPFASANLCAGTRPLIRSTAGRQTLAVAALDPVRDVVSTTAQFENPRRVLGDPQRQNFVETDPPTSRFQEAKESVHVGWLDSLGNSLVDRQFCAENHQVAGLPQDGARVVHHAEKQWPSAKEMFLG